MPFSISGGAGAGLSRLDLAAEAGISQWHLSCIETGCAAPSRDMVLHPAESLSMPPRERNTLLRAAGFAPVLCDRGLDHPDLAAGRRAVDALLAAHAPNPRWPWIGTGPWSPPTPPRRGCLTA